MRVPTLSLLALAASLIPSTHASRANHHRAKAAAAAAAVPQAVEKRQTVYAFPPATWSQKNRYVIMDNDYGSTAHIPFLIALQANMTVLGLTGNTANSWALQCTLHALALLEHGDLSCIPVALGEYYPLMMTQQRFKLWTQLWGTLEWDGVFAPENLTYEALGNDPTSGNANRVSKSAFVEGYPNNTYMAQSAPEFMIEQVFKYPHKVSIYAAGSLTNVAAAIRLNASFAGMAKELVVMGGYVDLNLMQTQSDLDQDLGSDINWIVDPEAAHMAITADWPSVTVAGNIANAYYMSSDYISEITTLHPNLYSDLLKDYYNVLPLWDETAALIMAFPDVVTNSTEVYMDVSTAYDSPFLGGTYVWGSDFAPSHTRKVNFVTALNDTMFWERFNASVSFPPTCVGGKVVF